MKGKNYLKVAKTGDIVLYEMSDEEEAERCCHFEQMNYSRMIHGMVFKEENRCYILNDTHSGSTPTEDVSRFGYNYSWIISPNENSLEADIIVQNESNLKSFSLRMNALALKDKTYRKKN